MSARNYSQAIGAGESINLPAGVFFMIRTAASALDVETIGNAGAPVRFSGIGAGSRFGPVAPGEGWRLLRVTSAAAQNIEIIISDDGLFDLANAVTIVGAAPVSVTPNTGFTASGADVARATGGADSIAANLSRKSITIGALSTNTGSLRVQTPGAGANRGRELQPGMTVTYNNTAALDIRNDSGASQTYWVEEET